MENRPLPQESAESRGGHEESHFSIRGYLWFLVIFVLTAAVLHVVLWAVYSVLAGNLPAVPVSPVARPAPEPPEPRLQGSRVHPATPREDLVRMRARDREILNSYGWVDRQAGVAQIPIDRAMELLLERGGSLPGPTQTGPATRPAGRAGESEK